MSLHKIERPSRLAWQGRFFIYLQFKFLWIRGRDMRPDIP